MVRRNRSKSPSPTIALNPYAKMDSDAKRVAAVNAARESHVGALQRALGADCRVTNVGELVSGDGSGAPVYSDRYCVSCQQSGGFRPSQRGAIESWLRGAKVLFKDGGRAFVDVPHSAYGSAALGRTRLGGWRNIVFLALLFALALWFIYDSVGRAVAAGPLVSNLIAGAFGGEKQRV